MWPGIIVATVLWGIAPLIEKHYAQQLSVPTIAIMFTVMLMLMAPLVAIVAREKLREEIPVLLTKKRKLLGLGLLGLVVSVVALGSYLHAMGQSGSRSYIVVSLTAAFPIITALLLWALDGERISGVGWLGIVLVAAGTAMTMYKPGGGA